MRPAESVPSVAECTLAVQGIYGEFFGLKEPPFDLTPNPRFLFSSARQREALSTLRYGLTTPRGFTLLVGEAGCGKTTVLNAALSDLSDSKSRCVFVTNPALTRDEFYRCLAREFGLPRDAAESKTSFLTELRREVETRFAERGLTGLIIDEAQSLPPELLEEIRLLGNMETTSSKLINIVLSGQPELSERLSESPLCALKQRIALRCELKPFDVAETSSYIAGRLRIAGGRPETIFTRDAVLAIYESTAGVPRTINVVCDNALIGGFAAGIRPVPVRIVKEVARDFDLLRTELSAIEKPATGSASADASERAAEPVMFQPQTKFGGAARAKRRFSFFCAIAFLAGSALSVATETARAQTPTAAKPIVAAQAGAPTLPTDYVIGPEDVLGIVFWRDADMTGDVTVRPDGMITLPLVGDLPAAGLKPDGLRDNITQAASPFLEDINVTVVVRQINSRKAFITGEVRAPGAYLLTGPRTVMQLIALAGGLTEFADGENVTIMRVEKGKTRTIKFNYKDVSKGKKLAQNIDVSPGDTVVVP